MARKLRVEYPGAIYHPLALCELPARQASWTPTPARAGRGGRREPIFRDNADRQRFVETLAEVCAKTGLAL